MRCSSHNVKVVSYVQHYLDWFGRMNVASGGGQLQGGNSPVPRKHVYVSNMASRGGLAGTPPLEVFAGVLHRVFRLS